MRITAIIQARIGSTRLPGKVLMDLGGKSVLSRVVDRLRRAKRLDEIVVAITDSVADDAIVRECHQLKVGYFRGPENDVLDRYQRAARVYAAQVVVRITADCPLIDPQLVDETIGAFQQQRADYASNLSPGVGYRGLRHSGTGTGLAPYSRTLPTRTCDAIFLRASRIISAGFAAGPD